VLLNKSSNGTYRLGLVLLSLGNNVLRRLNVRENALPYLKELTEKTNTTSYLCILDQDTSLCVERIKGTHAKLLLLNIGDRWPLYTGGTARAMLAYLDDTKINSILSTVEEGYFTKYALHTPTDYWSLIDSIRQTGYNVSYNDVLDGVSSIDAPIFDHNSKVIAAVSISNTSNMIYPKREEELAQMVVETANKISETLRWK